MREPIDDAFVAQTDRLVDRIPGGSTQAFRFARLSSGARIAWTRSGPPGAPTLVRVAHWLTNVEYDLRSPIWRPWVERLSRAF